jgi:peptide deformylase
VSTLNILTFPNKILRKKASEVDRVTDSERTILSDMSKTMYLHSGVGLAAPQVGIDKQLAVIDAGDGLINMANPHIIKKYGIFTEEEGCLSVPGVSVKVKRAKAVIVSFLNENNEVKELHAEGLLARVIQHELDHLSGLLIIDYLNPLKKLFMKVRRRQVRRR